MANTREEGFKEMHRLTYKVEKGISMRAGTKRWLRCCIIMILLMSGAGMLQADIEYSHHDFNHIDSHKKFATLPCIGCHDIHDVLLTDLQSDGEYNLGYGYSVDNPFEKSYITKVFWPDHSANVEWNAGRTCLNCHDSDNLDGSFNRYNIGIKMGRFWDTNDGWWSDPNLTPKDTSDDVWVEGREWGEKQSHHPLDWDNINSSNTKHSCTGCHAQHGVWDQTYNENYRDNHITDTPGTVTRTIADDINTDTSDRTKWIPKPKLLRARVGRMGLRTNEINNLNDRNADGVRRTQSETFCFTCHDSESTFNNGANEYRGYFNSTIVYRFRPHTDTFTHTSSDINGESISGRDATGGLQTGMNYTAEKVEKLKRRSSKFFMKTKHFRMSRKYGGEIAHPYGNTLTTPLHDTNDDYSDEVYPTTLLFEETDPGGDDGDVSCLVCHDIHGADYDNLIKADLYENDVCRMCHDNQTHDGDIPYGEYAGDPVKKYFGYTMREATDAEYMATTDDDHIKDKGDARHPADKREYYTRGHGSERVRLYLKTQNLEEDNDQFQNLKCSTCHEPHGSGQYKMARIWTRDVHKWKTSDGAITDYAHDHGFIGVGDDDEPPVYIDQIEMESDPMAPPDLQGYESTKISQTGYDVDELCFGCHADPAYSKDYMNAGVRDWEWFASGDDLGLYYMGKEPFVETMHYGQKLEDMGMAGLGYNSTRFKETGRTEDLKRSCRACHDPHGTDENANLLNHEENLCFDCHKSGVTTHGLDLPTEFAYESTQNYQPTGPYVDDDGAPLEGMLTKIKSMHDIYDTMQVRAIQGTRYNQTTGGEFDRITKVECVYCHNTHLASREKPLMNAGAPNQAFDTTQLYSSNTFCFACHSGSGPNYSRLGQDYILDEFGERILDDRKHFREACRIPITAAGWSRIIPELFCRAVMV